MNGIVIRKVDNFNSYDYIVYPESYINPLLKKSVLNSKLKSEIDRPCRILFDLLLCNGDCFNRFVAAEFDGDKIDKHSIRVVEIKSKCDIEIIEKYYVKNRKTLTKSVLVPSEYMMHC